MRKAYLGLGCDGPLRAPLRRLLLLALAALPLLWGEEACPLDRAIDLGLLLHHGCKVGPRRPGRTLPSRRLRGSLSAGAGAFNAAAVIVGIVLAIALLVALGRLCLLLGRWLGLGLRLGLRLRLGLGRCRRRRLGLCVACTASASGCRWWAQDRDRWTRGRKHRKGLSRRKAWRDRHTNEETGGRPHIEGLASAEALWHFDRHLDLGWLL